MRERPILFSSPMVRAILAGTKTVTRRVVTADHAADCDVWAFDEACGEWEVGVYGDGGAIAHGTFVRPRYGVPGDRLYVKEACWIWGRWTLNGLTANGRQRWRFRADAEQRVRFDRPEQVARRAPSQPGFDGLSGWVYRHARFMPRWASRITLEVAGVRVERVQDIGADDAAAEGIRYETGSYETEWMTPAERDRRRIRDFEALWDSINAARGFGWDANPWVWVVEFKPIEAAPRREGG